MFVSIDLIHSSRLVIRRFELWGLSGTHRVQTDGRRTGTGHLHPARISDSPDEERTPRERSAQTSLETIHWSSEAKKEPGKIWIMFPETENHFWNLNDWTGSSKSRRIFGAFSRWRVSLYIWHYYVLKITHHFLPSSPQWSDN